MIEYPRFKQSYHPVIIDEHESAVLSEISQYILHGRIYNFLIPLLNGEQNIDDIADLLSDRYSAPEVYFHLIQLEKKGLLEDGQGERLPLPEVFLHEICGPSSKIVRPSTTVNLISVGGSNIEQVQKRLSDPNFKFLTFNDFYSIPKDPSALYVVVTPDYFEKDLIEFNRKAISDKINWLLFKPLGLIPWIGPLFEHDEAGCLECLLHRLRGHRIIEYYHFKKNNPADSASLSNSHAPCSLDIACGFLRLEIAKIDRKCGNNSLKNKVLTIDLKNSEVTHHQLIIRPQCPVCGKVRSFSNKKFHVAAPPNIHARSKSGYRLNSERIIKAEETCRNLADHISPITGSIGALRRVTDIPDFFGYFYTSTWPSLGNMAGWFHKARLSPTGISTGKGMTDAQARASALGEALERYCTQYQGYEPKIRAKYCDIQDQAIDLDSLIPYSKSQYENRETWRKKAETSYVPDPFDKTAEVDWTPVWSLTRKQWKLVPSAYVYYNYPLDGGGLFLNGDSNGVAAGNCMEEAVLQAFFELVERDAVGIWWYNKILCPELDLSSFEISYAHLLQKGLSNHGYTLFCLDLTTDLDIPVVTAVALNKTDPEQEPLIGFGSHLDIEIALIRALTELGQSWNLRSTFRVNKYFQNLDGRPLSEMEYVYPDSAKRSRSKQEFICQAADDFMKDIEFCVEILKKHNMEMLLVDLTRPDVNLHVVRVIVPGLAHFWPRFGTKRLFDVPVKMGWIKTPNLESDLNPVPFYF
jgi:oxazoline/thiazoline synthase